MGSSPIGSPLFKKCELNGIAMAANKKLIPKILNRSYTIAIKRRQRGAEGKLISDIGNYR